MKKHKQINIEFRHIGFNVFTLNLLSQILGNKRIIVVDEFLYKILRSYKIKQIVINNLKK